MTPYNKHIQDNNLNTVILNLDFSGLTGPAAHRSDSGDGFDTRGKGTPFHPADVPKMTETATNRTKMTDTHKDISQDTANLNKYGMNPLKISYKFNYLKNSLHNISYQTQGVCPMKWVPGIDVRVIPPFCPFSLNFRRFANA